MRLTTKTVSALRPKSTTYWVSDDALPGFRLKVAPTGVKSFAVRLRSRGGRKNRTDTMQAIGRLGVLTVDQARAKARELLSRTVLGDNLAAEQRASRTAPTISELARQFLDERADKIKPRTVAEYRRLFDVEIVPEIGSTAARDLSRRAVAKLHHARRTRPYLANRCVTLIAALLNWAEKHGYLEANPQPTRGIELFVEKGRERRLSPAEMLAVGTALRTAASKGLPPDSKRAAYHERRHGKRKHPARLTRANPFAIGAIRFLMLSGWREQEALTLRWDMIDLDERRVDLPDSKSGRSYRDLGGAAVQLLIELPRLSGSRYVFPGQKTNRPLADIKHVWGAVREAAGLPTLRLHDLRHAFGSVGAEMGVPLLTLGAVLGHSEIETTKKYAHLGDDPVRRAADEISASIAASLSGQAKRPIALRR